MSDLTSSVGKLPAKKQTIAVLITYPQQISKGYHTFSLFSSILILMQTFLQRHQRLALKLSQLHQGHFVGWIVAEKHL